MLCLDLLDDLRAHRISKDILRRVVVDHLLVVADHADCLVSLEVRLNGHLAHLFPLCLKLGDLLLEEGHHRDDLGQNTQRILVVVVAKAASLLFAELVEVFLRKRFEPVHVTRVLGRRRGLLVYVFQDILVFHGHGD